MNRNEPNRRRGKRVRFMQSYDDSRDRADQTHRAVAGLEHVAAGWRAGGVRTSEESGGADLIGPPPGKAEKTPLNLVRVSLRWAA